MALNMCKAPEDVTLCTNPHCQRRIKQLEEELLRVKSVGYDIVKQRGSWQVAGKTPSDLSLEFNDFFDHEVEDFSKSIIQTKKMEEDKARQLVCSKFQTMNNMMQSVILNQLMDTLSRVFRISSPEEGNEQLYDICRAYGLLMNASGLKTEPIVEQLSTEAKSSLSKTFEPVSLPEVSAFANKSTELSWNLLTTIPPLLSCTPSSAYFREWHEKELQPTWNKDLINYKLVYYRPILFMSCDGKVARKGWVGNEESSKETKNDTFVIVENCAAMSKTSYSPCQQITSVLMPPPCQKHPCASSHSSLKSNSVESLPKDQPEEVTTQFYHQNTNVDASVLNTKSKPKKQSDKWSWSTHRRLM